MVYDGVEVEIMNDIDQGRVLMLGNNKSRTMDKSFIYLSHRKPQVSITLAVLEVLNPTSWP